MFAFFWEMRPYFREVAGQLALGSVAGIIMNTAVVLPAILLGQAIDRALALERGQATAGEVIRAFGRAPEFVAGFRRILRRGLAASNRSTFYSAVYTPMTVMLAALALAALLWAGTQRTVPSLS